MPGLTNNMTSYQQGLKDANEKASIVINKQAERIVELEEELEDAKRLHYEKGLVEGKAIGDRKYTVTFLPMGPYQSGEEFGLRISVIGTVRRANAQNLLGLKETKDSLALDPKIHRIQIHNLTLAEAFSLYQFLLPKNLQPIILEGLSC